MAIIKPYQRLTNELAALQQALNGLELKHGKDGQQVEIQSTANAIQWRYQNGSWQDLVQLADIKGAQGERGMAGADGKDGSRGIKGADGKNGVDGKQGLRGLVGNAGKDGKDAAPIELRKTDTYIQWKRQTETKWHNLIEIGLLRGPQGGRGFAGAAGVGVPAGGSAGQVLAKIDGANYNTTWVPQTGGGGSLTIGDSISNKTANDATPLGGVKTLAIGLAGAIDNAFVISNVDTLQSYFNLGKTALGVASLDLVLSSFTIYDETNTQQINVGSTGIKIGTGVRIRTVLDEDDMISDDQYALATQQSIKAYVDAHAGGSTDYTLQNEELTSTYAYAGYEKTAGDWYIYRRTRSGNVREYATGASSYATNWTNRSSLTYS